MTVTPIANGMFLRVSDASATELAQINYSFTKRPQNWFFIKKKNPWYEPDVSFFKIDMALIPSGLFQELEDVCLKYDFELNVNDPRGREFLTNESYNEQDIDNWLIDTFKDSSDDFKPYEYQVEALKSAVYNQRCTQEISTSGGKTLISYMLFKYLYDTKQVKRILYVVPNVGLVKQSEQKFYTYTELANKEIDFTTAACYSEAKHIDDDDIPNVVVGTYQSLVKKSDEFLSKFDMVLIDECHHGTSKSNQDILRRCRGARFKCGLTGTMPKKGTYESYMLYSAIGPTVNKLTSRTLIDEGHATPIVVVRVVLDYLDPQAKLNLFNLRNVHYELREGLKLYNMEKKIAREHPVRFNHIMNMVKKSSKNTLVLFADVQNNYGGRMYDWLRANSDRDVYYIDGQTKTINREFYKKQFTEGQGIIMIASTGTFSEGVDIPNIHNIFITESSKSEVVVAQILGRGMRLSTDKDKVVVIDFVDDFRAGTGNHKSNYLYKHGMERKDIYAQRKFPVVEKRINLQPSLSSISLM